MINKNPFTNEQSYFFHFCICASIFVSAFLYLRFWYIAMVLCVCLWVNFFFNSVNQSETETTIRIWKLRYMYAQAYLFFLIDKNAI